MKTHNLIYCPHCDSYTRSKKGISDIRCSNCDMKLHILNSN